MENDTRQGAAVLVRPGEGEVFRLFDYTAAWKAGGVAGGGAFSLFEPDVPPGAGAVPHVHHREDEALYVLDGRFALEIGERALVATAGDFLFAPRGLLHAFTNIGSAPGRLLTLAAPGGVEGLYRDTGRLLAAGDPPDAGALRRLTRRYGVEIPALGGTKQPGGATGADAPWRAATPGLYPPRPFVVAAGEGRRAFRFPDHRVWFKATAEDTGGAFSLLEVEVDREAGVPPHVHARADETLYVLSGRLAVQAGGAAFDAAAGACVFLPRRVPHAYRNPGDAPARALVLVTPGGLEHFLADLARFGDRASGADPVDCRDLMTLWKRHDILPVPPPE